MPTSKRDPLHASHIIEWIEQVMAFILGDLGEEIKGRSLENPEGGVLTIHQRDQKTPVVTLLKRLTEEPAQAWIPGGILASPKGARLPSCHTLPDGESYGDETKIWGIRNPDAYDQAVYLLIWDGRDLEHPKDKYDPRIHWPGWFSPSLKATDASPESKHQEALNTAECALFFLKKWKDKIKHEADQCPPIGTSSNSKETGTPPVVIIAGSANFYHDERHQSVIQNHHHGIGEEQLAGLYAQGGAILANTQESKDIISRANEAALRAGALAVDAANAAAAAESKSEEARSAVREVASDMKMVKSSTDEIHKSMLSPVDALVDQLVAPIRETKYAGYVTIVRQLCVARDFVAYCRQTKYGFSQNTLIDAVKRTCGKGSSAFLKYPIFAKNLTDVKLNEYVKSDPTTGSERRQLKKGRPVAERKIPPEQQADFKQALIYLKDISGLEPKKGNRSGPKRVLGGELLDGVQDKKSHAYDSWANAEAEKLRQPMGDTLRNHPSLLRRIENDDLLKEQIWKNPQLLFDLAAKEDVLQALSAEPRGMPSQSEN